MANEGANIDASAAWLNASSKSVQRILQCNPKQMVALLKSMFIDGAEEKDVRTALRQYGANIQSWAKIYPMSPWPAVNAPSNTNMRGLTQSLNRVINDPHPSAAVATPGVWIIIDKCWCGVAVRTYGEVSLGTICALPGAAATSTTSVSNPPSLPTMIPFGPTSQSKPGNFGAMYGTASINYGIPSWMTPPPSTGGTGSLPPYVLNGAPNPLWADTNGFLFNPGSWTPYVSASAAQSATFSSIMLLRCGKDQIQNSEQLAALYSTGRRITAMKNLYLTANAAGTSASGIGASCFSTDSRLYSWSPSVIESQGGKNSISQVTLVRSNPASDPQGLRSIQGSNVDQIMGPLEYGVVGGGLTTRTVQIYQVQIAATGYAPIYATGTTVPQSTELAPNGQNCVQNYVLDRQSDCYAKVLWISDKTTNVGGTYQQAQQISPNKVLVSGTTGSAVNNTYPTSEFSTLTSTKDVNIENVQIELTNEDAPPILEFSWKIGMGAASCGSMGNGCHIWAQIGPDDQVHYQVQPFGLGVWGLSGSGVSTQWAPFGIIPGGSFTTHAASVPIPVQPGSPGLSIFTRQWSWIGSYVCLTAMPNAQTELTISVSIPLENSPNVSGPVQVDRIDGASNGQQIVYSLRSQWEVLATSTTRTVDNKSGNVLQPMIDPKFPDLMRNLFASGNAEFFKVVFDEASWMQRVYTIMCMDSQSQFISLLGEQDFVRNASDPMHERISQLLIKDKDHKLESRVEEIADELEEQKKRSRDPLAIEDVQASHWFQHLTDKVESAVSHAKKGYQLAKQAHDAYVKYAPAIKGAVNEIRGQHNADSTYGLVADGTWGLAADAPYAIGDEEDDGGAMCDPDGFGADMMFSATPSKIETFKYKVGASPNGSSSASASYRVPLSPWITPLITELGLPLELSDERSLCIRAKLADTYSSQVLTMSMIQMVDAYMDLSKNAPAWSGKACTTKELVAASNTSNVPLLLLAAGKTPGERKEFIAALETAVSNCMTPIVGLVAACQSVISQAITNNGGKSESFGNKGAYSLFKDDNGLIIAISPKSSLARQKGGFVGVRVVSETARVLKTLPSDFMLMIGIYEARGQELSVVLTGSAANKVLALPKYLSKVAVLEELGRQKTLQKFQEEHKEPSKLTDQEFRGLCARSAQNWETAMTHEAFKRKSNVPILLFILQFTCGVITNGIGGAAFGQFVSVLRAVPSSDIPAIMETVRKAQPDAKSQRDLEEISGVSFEPFTQQHISKGGGAAVGPRQEIPNKVLVPNRLVKKEAADKVKVERD